MKHRRLVSRAAVASTIALSGCAAHARQAPLSEARKLDRGTSAVASACGEAYERAAFAPHADLRAQERQAQNGATKIAWVLRRDPGGYYQGETVRQISGAAVGDLRACGLQAAAVPLAHDSR